MCINIKQYFEMLADPIFTEMNAFVIPGGKVFVFTGILPIAKTDDGLATVHFWSKSSLVDSY